MASGSDSSEAHLQQKVAERVHRLGLFHESVGATKFKNKNGFGGSGSNFALLAKRRSAGRGTGGDTAGAGPGRGGGDGTAESSAPVLRGDADSVQRRIRARMEAEGRADEPSVKRRRVDASRVDQALSELVVQRSTPLQPDLGPEVSEVIAQQAEQPAADSGTVRRTRKRSSSLQHDEGEQQQEEQLRQQVGKQGSVPEEPKQLRRSPRLPGRRVSRYASGMPAPPPLQVRVDSRNSNTAAAAASTATSTTATAAGGGEVTSSAASERKPDRWPPKALSLRSQGTKFKHLAEQLWKQGKVKASSGMSMRAVLAYLEAGQILEEKRSDTAIRAAINWYGATAKFVRVIVKKTAGSRLRSLCYQGLAVCYQRRFTLNTMRLARMHQDLRRSLLAAGAQAPENTNGATGSGSGSGSSASAAAAGNSSARGAEAPSPPISSIVTPRAGVTGATSPGAEGSASVALDAPVARRMVQYLDDMEDSLNAVIMWQNAQKSDRSVLPQGGDYSTVSMLDIINHIKAHLPEPGDDDDDDNAAAGPAS